MYMYMLLSACMRNRIHVRCLPPKIKYKITFFLLGWIISESIVKLQVKLLYNYKRKQCKLVGHMDTRIRSRYQRQVELSCRLELW